jgi:hypothetical protein
MTTLDAQIAALESVIALRRSFAEHRFIRASVADIDLAALESARQTLIRLKDA